MKKPLLSFLFALGAMTAVFGGEVALRFSPAPDAPVAFHVSDSDPALQSAQPANGAPANWFTVNWKGLYTGWSQQANAQKDLTLQDNSPIYARPDASSLMLGRVPPGVQVAVAEVVDAWAKVRFTATMPLYFYKEPAKIAPPPAPKVESQPASAVSSRVSSAVSDASKGELTGQPRFYKGILKERRTMPAFKQAPYEFQLNTLEGEVVGLVDFKDVISSTPAASYLNQKVTIYGVGAPFADYPYCVIRVKFIQPLDAGVMAPPSRP